KSPGARREADPEESALGLPIRLAGRFCQPRRPQSTWGGTEVGGRAAAVAGAGAGRASSHLQPMLLLAPGLPIDPLHETANARRDPTDLFAPRGVEGDLLRLAVARRHADLVVVRVPRRRGTRRERGPGRGHRVGSRDRAELVDLRPRQVAAILRP